MLLSLGSLIKEYNLPVRGAIHVGAHLGQELHDYINIGFKSIAVFEPQVSKYNALLRRLDEFSSVDFRLFPLALGSSHRLAQLHVSVENDGQSSSILKPDKHLDLHPEIHFSGKEEVFVTRMDHVISNASDYNFVNIDVQGFELEVLKGMGHRILGRVDSLLLEVNKDSVYESCPHVDEIDAFLDGFGFKRVQTNWAGGMWGDAFYINTVSSRLRSLGTVSTAEPFLEIAPDKALVASGSKPLATLGSTSIPDDCVHGAYYSQFEHFYALIPPSSLQVLPLGRYGNQVTQVFNALAVAVAYGINEIYIPRSWSAFRCCGTPTANDCSLRVEYYDDNVIVDGALRSRFSFPAGSLSCLYSRVTVDHARKARDLLRKVLAPLDGCGVEDGMCDATIYIRSGDVFRHPHPLYAQPPLSYYKASIRHLIKKRILHDKPTVRIVCEDASNPVYNQLLQWFDKKNISASSDLGASFALDLQRILESRILIASYSSLMEVAWLLSDSLEYACFFGGIGRWRESYLTGSPRYELLPPASLDKAFIFDVPKRYQKLTAWSNSKIQRRIMLRCSTPKPPHLAFDMLSFGIEASKLKSFYNTNG